MNIAELLKMAKSQTLDGIQEILMLCQQPQQRGHLQVHIPRQQQAVSFCTIRGLPQVQQHKGEP